MSTPPSTLPREPTNPSTSGPLSCHYGSVAPGVTHPPFLAYRSLASPASRHEAYGGSILRAHTGRPAAVVA